MNETSPPKLILPSHMKKALLRLELLTDKTDIVFEITDARAPLISRSPTIEKILKNTPVIRILAKADLASPAATRSWLSAFCNAGVPAEVFTSTGMPSPEKFLKKIQHLQRDFPYNQKRLLRGLVVGIPNTGKSTFINYLLSRRSAPVSARPGATRSFQLLNIAPNFYLYDTPGILPPRCEIIEQRHILALIGALQESFFNPEETARYLYSRLLEDAPDELAQRYLAAGASLPESFDAFVETAAVKRKFIKKGGLADTDRLCRAMVNDFTKGKICKITLENPH